MEVGVFKNQRNNKRKEEMKEYKEGRRECKEGSAHMVHMCFYFSYESGCFTNFINDDFPPYPQYKSSSLKTLSKTLKISTLVHFVIDILFDTCLSIPYFEHYVKSSLFQSCAY